MRFFNNLYLIVLAIFMVLISSMLWIGSYEEAQKLKQSFFASYNIRFLSFSILGLFGILFLILINWIRNAMVTFTGIINLKSLFLKGLLCVLISSSVGVLLFFLIS